jgi:succinate dehydrogenase/fumarate reductase-like Fe-S protein
MRLTLEVWRQADAASPGRFERYEVDGVTDEVSMLELLDMLNAQLVAEGREAVAFDHDCREGICGTCGLMVNGRPHGPQDFTPACLQRVRTFSDGDVVTLEPWRAGAFPVVRDLVVDRSAMDRIIAAGGYISTATRRVRLVRPMAHGWNPCWESHPSGVRIPHPPQDAMSRDTDDRCLGTSFHVWRGWGPGRTPRGW